MPHFEPFPGIRYATPAHDPAVTTAPPYDVISPAEREGLVALDTHNVVRIDLPIAEDGGEDPYLRAAQLWHQWHRDGVLVTDEAPTLTVYRMESTDDDGRPRRTTGVIGALTLSPPGADGILPHEFTTPKAKSDRLDLLRATSANLSPVWGLSPAPGLTALLDVDRPPVLRFTDPDAVTHSVWVLDDPDHLASISAMVSAHPVVIADGHHRYETSLAYLAERKSIEADGGPPTGAATSVLCFVVELAEDELTVDPIHRLLSGLPDDFDLLAAFEPSFALEPLVLGETGAVERLQSEGGLALVLPDGTWLARPRPEAMTEARDLDSSRLDVALAALPDPVVVYQHGVEHIRSAVATGAAQAGVLLRPATVAQIVAIAHGGERMPPKTTFFSPKPRTGIVFRDLT